MAFRKTGNFYVSKAGSDSNPGTASQPFLTLQHAANVAQTAGAGQNIIVGTGTYEESADLSSINITLLADGAVVIKGNGNNNIGLTNIDGFKIQDFAGLYTVQYQHNTLNNLDLINIPNIAPGLSQTVTFLNCKLVNCEVTAAGGSVSFDHCILVNTSTAAIVTSFSDSYANGASSLRMAGIGGLNNSNIMGDISFTGGDQSGVEMDLAAIGAAYPGTTGTCFSLDPQFNAAAKQDFTLQAGSPHLKRGTSGTNIGGTSYAKSINIVNALDMGAVLYQLETQGQDLVISPGYSSGYILFPPIAIAANPQAISRIDFAGLLLFNKAAAGGTDTNKYVPDAAVYAGNDAGGGGNPDRLVIEIRTSTHLAQPAADADYDNNGYAGAGAFLKVPINEQPLVDNFYRGNGEPDFDTTAYQPVVAIWVQAKVTLTNAYN